MMVSAGDGRRGQVSFDKGRAAGRCLEHMASERSSPASGGSGCVSCHIVLLRHEHGKRGAAAWCRCLIKASSLHAGLVTGLLDLDAVEQAQEHCLLMVSTPCSRDVRVCEYTDRRRGVS
jgi:hypothetical protein